MVKLTLFKWKSLSRWRTANIFLKLAKIDFKMVFSLENGGNNAKKWSGWSKSAKSWWSARKSKKTGENRSIHLTQFHHFLADFDHLDHFFAFLHQFSIDFQHILASCHRFSPFLKSIWRPWQISTSLSKSPFLDQFVPSRPCLFPFHSRFFPHFPPSAHSLDRFCQFFKKSPVCFWDFLCSRSQKWYLEENLMLKRSKSALRVRKSAKKCDKLVKVGKNW